VDGNDVVKVYQTTLDAVQIVRNHSKPYFLVLNTYRLGPHSKGDDDRPPEELELHWEGDPIKRLSKKLPVAKKNNIEREIEDKVEAIIKQAIEDSPMVSLDFIQRVS
jgi:TPP-dependent pyruvate/acetoin dehydrogenase alpha subunit